MAWSATQYDIERLENVLAYLRLKDRLESRERGKWVAIAGGRLVASASTLQRAIADANKAAPRVMHRFVFRVGARGPEIKIGQTVTECKDTKECSRNLVSKTALGKLLQKEGGKLEDDYDKNQTCVTLKGKTTCWKWQGGKAGIWEEFGAYDYMQCIEVEVDKPGTKEKKKLCALLDTGLIGTFMALDADTFLDVATTTEDPDDTNQAETVGGKVNVRKGFASFEIPQAGFSNPVLSVATNKDALKAEVERRKKEEEKKKKDEEDAKKKKDPNK